MADILQTQTQNRMLGQMPSLPLTQGLFTKSSTKPEYVTAEQMAPAMEETRKARSGLMQEMDAAAAEQQRLDQERTVAREEQKLQLRQEEAKMAQESPERQALKLARDELKNAAFVPSKDNAKDMATMFSLIGIIGMAVGGEGKLSAYNTMGAMNGMLEGYQKGRADIYKREKDIFEKNIKVLQNKVTILQTELQEALQTYRTNRELGEQQAEIAFAKAGSKIGDAILKKQGIQRAVEYIDGVSKDTGTLVTIANDQTKRAEDMRFKERELEQQKQLRLAQIAATREAQLARLEAQQGKVTQQNMMAQRAVNSLGGVASALESLSELPTGTTTGLLPNLQTKDGFLNYMRNNLGRKISSKEAEMMNTIFTGIGRNLASIEASGAATGLTQLANQMQSGLYINAGIDDPYKVAIKLADIRRIATENIRPAIESGLMPPGQAKTADALVKRIEQAIPFTTSEYYEWGNPNDETYYRYMLSYSPYDNVRAAEYPNLLVTTGLHDSQVQYWEPAKWVAKLRDVHQGNNKIYLVTDMEAGHGGKSGRYNALKDDALEFAFLLDLAGIKP